MPVTLSDWFSRPQGMSAADAHIVGQSAQWADQVLTDEWQRLRKKIESITDVHAQKDELVASWDDAMAELSISKRWTRYVAVECAKHIGAVCNAALDEE